MLVALDFETTGLEMYQDAARVTSVATAWRESDEIKTRFSTTPDRIRADMEHLSRYQIPLLVYNVGFEGLVFLTQFTDLKFNVHADVMRLVQLYANDDSVTSYGLKQSAPRILGAEAGGWENEINQWLSANGFRKNDYHLAPHGILRRYNCGDVVATLKLFEHIRDDFARNLFDWTFDQRLYLSSAHQITESKARGIAVNRPKLQEYVNEIERDLSENEAAFLSRFSAEVAQVERLLTEKEQAKFKKKIVERVAFNVDSSAHRTLLFCRILGIEPKYTTPSGEPSMKSEHLGTYGDGGAMLADRKSRQIVLTQAQNLLALSEYDGRWHSDLKLAGTSTGRYAGGSQ